MLECLSQDTNLKVGREKTHMGNIRKVETFQDIAYCTFLNSCHTNLRKAKDFFTPLIAWLKEYEHIQGVPKHNLYPCLLP